MVQAQNKTYCSVMSIFGILVSISTEQRHCKKGLDLNQYINKSTPLHRHATAISNLFKSVPVVSFRSQVTYNIFQMRHN